MAKIIERVLEVLLILGILLILGCQSFNGFAKDVGGLASYVDSQIVDE